MFRGYSRLTVQGEQIGEFFSLPTDSGSSRTRSSFPRPPLKRGFAALSQASNFLDKCREYESVRLRVHPANRASRANVLYPSQLSLSRATCQTGSAKSA